MSHSDGKCDCAVKHDVDLTSVKAMKAWLAGKNVKYDDCLQKDDLVARVIETQKKLEKEQSAEGKKSDESKDQDGKTAGKAIIKTKQVGPLKCNMTIIADPETKEAVLVDPGGDSNVILSMIKEMGVKIVSIVCTHAHFDHILAAGDVRKSTGAPIRFHKNDLQLWKMLPLQGMLIGLQGLQAIDLNETDKFIEDGEKLSVLDLRCIHTPGHTPGSMCFYSEKEKLLCSGDTLFHQSVGRTDLPGGDSAALVRSIQEKLYTLPDNVKVIPGHNEHTTIGYEKKNNAVVRAKM